MGTADYYPLGAYNDPRAPWNQEDNEPVAMPMECSFELAWEGEIETDMYYVECCDEDGSVDYHLCDDCDEQEEYDNMFPDPAQLLKNYSELIERLCSEGYFKTREEKNRYTTEAYAAKHFEMA